MSLKGIFLFIMALASVTLLGAGIASAEITMPSEVSVEDVESWVGVILPAAATMYGVRKLIGTSNKC